jgi:bifunctional DNA-binding transcriptional regulator/antitoxin component of YhaV-PrlF toxin-antitoxin module
LRKEYKVVGENGRIYLSKELRMLTGIACGSMIKLTAKKGVIMIEPVTIIEAGDHNPEAVESYILSAGRVLERETKLMIAGEFLEQAKQEQEDG